MVAFEVEVLSFFLDAADMLGVPKSVAAIYGICFASPIPLSFADIHGRLTISQGSVSQGLRLLREIGALKVFEQLPVTISRVVSSPIIVRGAFYEPDLELRKLVTHYFEQRVEQQLSSGHGTLDRIAKQIPAENGGSKILKVRIRQLQNWHDQTRKLLPLVKMFLKLT